MDRPHRTIPGLADREKPVEEVRMFARRVGSRWSVAFLQRQRTGQVAHLSGQIEATKLVPKKSELVLKETGEPRVCRSVENLARVGQRHIP